MVTGSCVIRETTQTGCPWSRPRVSLSIYLPIQACCSSRSTSTRAAGSRKAAPAVAARSGGQHLPMERGQGLPSAWAPFPSPRGGTAFPPPPLDRPSATSPRPLPPPSTFRSGPRGRRVRRGAGAIVLSGGRRAVDLRRLYAAQRCRQHQVHGVWRATWLGGRNVVVKRWL